jgi:hypothetical protein
MTNDNKNRYVVSSANLARKAPTLMQLQSIEHCCPDQGATRAKQFVAFAKTSNNSLSGTISYFF